MNFHILTSKEFWSGAPLVISEIVRRGHFISVIEDQLVPSYQKLLDCDVFIDMSAIKRASFYRRVHSELSKREKCGLNTPVMVDPPTAIMNSLDKRRTHKIFHDLVPESFSLTGHNNKRILNLFLAEQYVVTKPINGWGGLGVELLTPAEALTRHRTSTELIVQQYIPDTRGIGRAVTLTSNGQCDLVCAYRRIPEGWRTGIDVPYTCVSEEISPELCSFAAEVSLRSGLYLNGIDYVFHNGRYFLLEVNAVPAMKEPLDEFGVNIPALLMDRLERDVRLLQSARPVPSRGGRWECANLGS